MWSWCPGPRLVMSSSRLQEKKTKQWWKWGTKALNVILKVQCVCGTGQIQKGQCGRDAGGLLDVMVPFYNNEGLGLTVEAATDVPAGACAGTHWTQDDKEH